MATYSTSQQPYNNTMALFQAWAGPSTGIAYALSQLGLTKMSDTYTANWSSATTIGAQAIPTSAGNPMGANFGQTVASGQRLPLPASNFMGAYSSATTYSAGDVVTFTVNSVPLVYVFINATPTANQAPMSYSSPNYTLNSTYWAPYYMEIWEMGGGAGSLTPFYIKLEYGTGTSAGYPALTMQIGTGYSTGASGYLTGNVTQTQQVLAGASDSATAYPMYFSGDGVTYLNMALFPNNSGTTWVGHLSIERSISGQTSGTINYTSSYVTYLTSFNNTTWQQTMNLTGSPYLGPRLTDPVGGYQFAGSALFTNQTPACQITPSIGIVGNPLTSIMLWSETDAVANGSAGGGNTFQIYVYGAFHTYIGTYNYYPYFNIWYSGTAYSNTTSALLRWE